LHVVDVAYLISQLVELVVEDHSGASLALELNANPVVLSDSEQFNLDFSLLFDYELRLGLLCLFQFLLLFLFCHGPFFGICDLPVLVVDFILGSIFLKGINNFLEDLLGSVISEEGSCLRHFGIVGFHGKLDELRVFRFFLGEFFTHIDVICNDFTSAGSDLLLHGHLAVFLFGSASLVDLVAFGELLRDLLLGSNLALHPWVANNVSHAEALVWVNLEHAGDEVLELVGEEASCLSV